MGWASRAVDVLGAGRELGLEMRLGARAAKDHPCRVGRNSCKWGTKSTFFCGGKRKRRGLFWVV